MGSGFEALSGMAAEIKEKARKRQESLDKQERVTRRIARETGAFIDAMTQMGVKRSAGVPLQADAGAEDIDFAGAMARAGVRPLDAPARMHHRRKVSTAPLKTIEDNRSVLRESLSDEADPDDFLESDDGLSFRRPCVGPDVPKDLRRGRWAVVGQLDMHGMFVEEAREALVKFLSNAQANERLCLRIIHGKGNGSPAHQAVLRDKVRRWLKQRDEVVAFAEPRENDGGAGATLVRIRPKDRAKG